MDFKDYYSILGVPPEADKKEVKKAYQALTKKYHPDLNPGNKEVEEKYKEINEAYQALSDPDKRKKYDDLRANYQQWQNRGGSGNFDWSAWQEAPGGNTYSRTMTAEEFAEIFGSGAFAGRGGGRGGGFAGSAGGGAGGSDGFSDFFSAIFGMGRRMDNDDNYDIEDYYGNVVRSRVGRDLEGKISITLAEAYHGTKRIIEVGKKKIEANIPKGIKDGNKMRLAGQGSEGLRGGTKGDLLLTVNILPDPAFTRDGDDLKADLEIDFYTAVLGGEKRLQTFGGEIILKIPPRTQAGKTFRVKGKGMPVINQTAKYGDFYARVVIVLPKNLSDQEVETLQNLKKKINQ